VTHPGRAAKAKLTSKNKKDNVKPKIDPKAWNGLKDFVDKDGHAAFISKHAKRYHRYIQATFKVS
jgi:hypothetical protein